MIPELYSGRRGFLSAHLFKLREVSRSDGVVAISNASVSQYRAVVARPREDIKVIPLGASLPKNFRHGNPIRLPEKYFLFVGQRSGHKNAKLVLEALAGITNLEWGLVFVGGGRLSSKEVALAEDLGLHERVSCIAISDDDLPVVYKNASALIVPSKIEGFGLPLVEAALFGCPVIAARIPVFEEVMGDAAVYFDPNDPIGLSTLMQSLIDGELPLEQLKSSANRIAQRFTWYECASQTALYYREVVNNKLRDY
jgi:glycosyltransferase involved in cell wall biosynthesis